MKLQSAAIVLCGILSLAAVFGCKKNPESTSTAEAAAAPTPAPVASIDDARRCAVGIWTYSEARSDIAMNWKKWDIKDDGTCQEYSAPPVADNWGRPEKCLWKIKTDKYTDTGTRYYAFWTVKAKDANDFGEFFITDCETMNFMGDGFGPIKKGDAFPFSK